MALRGTGNRTLHPLDRPLSLAQGTDTVAFQPPIIRSAWQPPQLGPIHCSSSSKIFDVT